MRIRIMLILLAVMGLMVMAGCGGKRAYVRPETNLPISHEGTLVEVVSACEWMVTTAGIGEGKKEHLDSLANQDARKAAIHFIVLGGTDPLVQTESERKRFDLIKEELFLPHNFRPFILFESPQYDTRVMIERKEKLKIEKKFTVDRCRIQKWLAERGIVEPPDEVDLGMPFVAVLPMARQGENPVELLQTDQDALHAATVIESHLTALQYDVTVPTQREGLANLVTVSKYLKNAQTDNEYVAASSIGSDIHIVFDMQMTAREVAATVTRKVTANIRAYETTTARLLGSETGYSAERPSPITVLIEEAINDAIAKVLSRIQAYWKNDLERGIQYKIHFALSPALPTDTKTRIKYAVHDVLKARCKIVKPVISTENNFDYQVWVDPDDISDFLSLQRYIDVDIRSEIPQVQLSEVVSNRKLVIYELK